MKRSFQPGKLEVPSHLLEEVCLGLPSILNVSSLTIQTQTLYMFKFLILCYICSSLTIFFPCIHSLKDFKEFADAIEAVKNSGVVVAVASPEDVTRANTERSGFFEVKKVL